MNRPSEPVQAGDPPDRRQIEAEALADPTRHGIFVHLESADGPLGIGELTEAAGVHHTVVRQHLAKLRDAGLVLQATASPSGRGRPRFLYSPNPEASARWADAVSYRRLAGLLAEAVSRHIGPRDMGRLAGIEAVRSSGRAGRSPGWSETTEAVVSESVRMGFDPRLEVISEDHNDVVLGHCPFNDIAADDPETVCALHMGMAEGVLEELGGAEVEGMTVNDPHRAGCRLHLKRLATG